MTAPTGRTAAQEDLRPPSARERVLVATLEVLLGRRHAPPPALVERLLATLTHAAERPRPPRP